VARAKRLEADTTWVCAAVPIRERSLRKLQAFSLDDRHLTPCAIEPDIPRDMTGRAPQAAIALEGMEAVVERVIDFAFDQSAADP
jgi:hypothetical protein